jgi:hypothetical protein
MRENSRHMQIWRLVTCFAYFGRLGFPFLMNVYFLYNYSLRLETGAKLVPAVCVCDV